MTTKKNSLLFKIKPEDQKIDFNVNNFIDLFLTGGLFESYLDEIFGIATHNYNLKIYNVTFKESTPKTIIEDIYENFKDPQEISTSDGLDLTIQVNRPPGYRQLVTLYPMPFDINIQNIQLITKNWGTLKSFEFGKHKKCPLIRNPYLHLFFENFNRKSIPDSLNFRNRFVSINIDGEAPKPRCNYCKDTDHLIENCPHKAQQNHQTNDKNIPKNPTKPTYAKAITSTPKTNDTPFFHPLTKLKLTQKNLQKSTQNFPSLNQDSNNTQSEQIENTDLNSTIPNNNQEEIIKSFEDTQTKQPPQATKKEEENSQITSSPKISINPKRRHSLSSQSSSLSIDLKPQRKKNNKGEGKKRDKSE